MSKRALIQRGEVHIWFGLLGFEADVWRLISAVEYDFVAGRLPLTDFPLRERKAAVIVHPPQLQGRRVSPIASSTLQKIVLPTRKHPPKWITKAENSPKCNKHNNYYQALSWSLSCNKACWSVRFIFFYGFR